MLQHPPAHAEHEGTMPAHQPRKRFFVALPCEAAFGGLWIFDGDRSLRAVAPLATDVKLLWDLVENLLFFGGGDRAHSGNVPRGGQASTQPPR